MEWRAGDAVLYGLRLRQGNRLRHWLLHVEVEQPQARASPGAAAVPFLDRRSRSVGQSGTNDRGSWDRWWDH